MTATTHITIPYSEYQFPGLNGDDGLIREHWAARKKRIANIQLLLRSKTKATFKGPVTVVWHRYACSLMDWDNHCASFKNTGDALKKNKTITEDNPAVIVEFLPRQTKVATKKEERVELIIFENDLKQ